MASGLPGRAPPPQSKKPTKGGKPSKHSDETDEGKIEELSFEEIRALEQEFIELTQGKVKKDLEAVRKKREEDELLGRKRTVEKTDLSDIETAFTGKKGGLPEHLANLPPEHPLRARFEQGFRRRPDGTWYKSGTTLSSHGRKKSAPMKKAALYWLPLILVLMTFFVLARMYHKELEHKRATIIEIVKKKGLALNDPVIRRKYQLILITNWLPDLERLLREIERIPRNFDAFPDNPEVGSYIDYIKKHSKPFDEKDAQEWYTRSIRKPAWSQ